MEVVLPIAERWRRDMDTLGEEFFSFFSKNMDGEGIWGHFSRRSCSAQIS
jgi:hypothetical protein